MIHDKLSESFIKRQQLTVKPQSAIVRSGLHIQGQVEDDCNNLYGLHRTYVLIMGFVVCFLCLNVP